MERDNLEAAMRTMRLAIAQTSIIARKDVYADGAVKEELESIELALRLLLKKLENLSTK
jgi:hypothetical protein